jgi:hypothetical protein
MEKTKKKKTRRKKNGKEEQSKIQNQHEQRKEQNFPSYPTVLRIIQKKKQRKELRKQRVHIA